MLFLQHTYNCYALLMRGTLAGVRLAHVEEDMHVSLHLLQYYMLAVTENAEHEQFTLL